MEPPFVRYPTIYKPNHLSSEAMKPSSQDRAHKKKFNNFEIENYEKTNYFFKKKERK